MRSGVEGEGLMRQRYWPPEDAIYFMVGSGRSPSLLAPLRQRNEVSVPVPEYGRVMSPNGVAMVNEPVTR